MKFYSVDSEKVISYLNSSLNGINEREALKRLKIYGENSLKDGKRKNPFFMFIGQFNDFMTILLMIAAAVSAVIAFVTKNKSEVADTMILVFIILVNNIIGFIQQYRADNAIEKMKQLSKSYSKVIRNGKSVVIDSKYLVKGDIVEFEEGDRVCADCRILTAKNLLCNESSLTGESEQVEKDVIILKEDVALAERKNMLYSSTYVIRGRAKAIVVETGMNTEIGKIADMIGSAETISTPLENALDRLGKIISYAVVAIAAFIFVFGIFFRKVDLLPNFMSSVAIAVAAIPEGLPAVVTIIMALGVQRMSTQRAIVRKLQAVETLGGCDCICSDKTGTLTQNKMYVQEVEDFGNKYRVIQCMRFCNSVKENMTGDATEIALVEYVDSLNEHISGYKKIDEIPFDSERKMMSVFMENDKEKIMFTKGGAEILMEKCTYFSENGKVRPITPNDKKSIMLSLSRMANKALRTLGFAYKTDGDFTEENLVFSGVCGMLDPPKEGAAEAVKICKEAGINMIMITGDQKDTAFAVVKRLKIAFVSSDIVTGGELDELSGKALERRILSSKVFARVNPEHKSLIVGVLQKNNKVVAMTGDGVNDAPALKKAEIGVAMGSGTDVTKSVADMVITDDNFSTIVKAVAEGRRIFANIRKTVAFFLATNLSEVMAILAITLFLPECCFLNSTQLLWINLVTDSFPVFALGVERAERDIMKLPPKRAEKEIFSLRFFLPVIIFGIIQSLISVGIFVYFLKNFGNEQACTAAMLSMSFTELFYAFNVKTERESIMGKKFLDNKILLMTVGAGGLLTVLLSVLPVFRAAFGLTTLNIAQWGIIFMCSAFIIPLGEVYKFILRLKRKSSKSYLSKRISDNNICY